MCKLRQKYFIPLQFYSANNMAEEIAQKNENSIQLKRLFIGGLYKGVTKEDLRLKFKRFGDVKDLDIITRCDDSGEHLKTFAYINIGISDKNFRKCVTIYNKCNWKGNVLKVEVAKEDYLTRLQKENQSKFNLKQPNNIPDISVIGDIKSAVPGTPVPEKRNWVVGKFGRALPIVFLRRRDRRKIAKFDPSKTVHCLKKLDRKDIRQVLSVDSLTWNLDDNTSVHSAVDNRSVRERVSIKCSSHADEDDNSHRSTTKMKSMDWEYDFHDTDDSKTVNNKNYFCQGNSKQRSSNEECDLSQNEKSGFQNFPNSQVKYSSESNVFRSLDQNSDSDTTSLSSCDGSDSKDLSPVDGPCLNKSSSAGSEITENGSQRTWESLCKADQSDECNMPSSKNSKCNSVESKFDDENYEQHTDNQVDFPPNSESVSQKLDSNKILNTNDSCLLNFAKISPSPSTSSSEGHSKPKESLRTSTTFEADMNNKSKTKQEVSNRIRLETLKERKGILKSQKEIVKNALQKVDGRSGERKNHIIFGNDDDSVKEENLKSSHHGEKITGSKALAWLGMDSSSDEGDFGEKVDRLVGKDHFDGRSGEKLMKLQQTFGHDQRFKMDERFLDSDEEIESSPKTPMVMEDEVDNQLKEEKLLSLKVLQDVLGKNSVFLEENEDSRNLYRDSIDTHYDPSREDHTKFEEEITKAERPGQNNESRIVDDLPELATEPPVITQDKFYTVSDSLKDIFEKKRKENCTFSFFPDLDEKNDEPGSISGKQTEKIKDWKAPVKLSQALPYDSSSSESEDDIKESTRDAIPAKVNTSRCLFYHPDNQAMMDELEAESSSFMRKESVENLTRYWQEVRQKITQDYKKKRKDALRRQKRTSFRRVEN